MAKIHFIQDSVFNESLGIMQLSAYLKQHDHTVKLTILKGVIDQENILAEVRNFDADLVAFSVMTPQADFYLEVSKIIKQNTNKTIIWGGPHCTFMPDVVKQDGVVDIIAVGEAEEGLLELAESIDRNEPRTDIRNLHFKDGADWIVNDIRELEHDLDKYPPPDRDSFYSVAEAAKKLSVKRFLTQRGCPHSCNYCFEPAMRNMYSGKGKFVRRHSVDYVIKEILDVKSKYTLKSIHFHDDSFNINKKWCKEFFIKYKEKVGLPFSCNVAIPNIDEEMVADMKNAGCVGVIFGLETPNEDVRTGILNKKVTNKQIYFATSLFRKYKLRFYTNNMSGLPTERLSDTIRSIKMNKEIGAFSYNANFLKAYKGTILADIIVENGFAEKSGKFTYKVKDKYNEHELMHNIAKMGTFLMMFPFLIPHAKTLARMPFAKILHLLFFIQGVRFNKISFLSAISWFLADVKIFLGGLANPQKDTYSDC